MTGGTMWSLWVFWWVWNIARADNGRVIQFFEKEAFKERLSVVISEQQSVFWLLLMHSEGCAASTRIQSLIESIDDIPKFQINASEEEAPKLVLVVTSESQQLQVTEYDGPINNAADLRRYIYNIRHFLNHTDAVSVATAQPPHLPDFDSLWEHVDQVTQTAKLLPPPAAEAFRAEYQFSEPRTIVHVVCSLQNTASSTDLFANVTRALSQRPDRWLVRVNECYQGDTPVIRVYNSTRHLIDSCQTLDINCLVRVTADHVLWYDRSVAANVAFPDFRQLHLAVFVDPSKLPHQILDELDTVCKRRRDFVCLIVPNTENRILNTFGITQFPTVMITDRRTPGRTLQYRLPHEMSISDFAESFSELPLHVSRSVETHKNEFGVTVLGSRDMPKFRVYSLVLVTHATCGHCLRLIPIWNRLQQFMTAIGFDDDLDLYMVDISLNDDSVWEFPAPASVPAIAVLLPDGWSLSERHVTDLDDLLEWLVDDVIQDRSFLERLQTKLDG